MGLISISSVGAGGGYGGVHQGRTAWLFIRYKRSRRSVAGVFTWSGRVLVKDCRRWWQWVAALFKDLRLPMCLKATADPTELASTCSLTIVLMRELIMN